MSLVYPSEDLCLEYTGDWTNKFHGYGIIKYKDGTEWEGKWNHGEKILNKNLDWNSIQLCCVCLILTVIKSVKLNTML